MKVSQQKEAARLLGVSATALRQWRAEPGFPDCSDGWDVDAIRAWRDARDRKGAPSSDKSRDIKLATAAQQLRLAKAKADKAEREEAIAAGNILPRDEYELANREQIQLARDRLLGLPKHLCRIVPKKYHAALQTEGGKLVRSILAELARGLDRGPIE